MYLLLLMFLTPPLRGAGPMALMLEHEWQHIYTIQGGGYDEIVKSVTTLYDKRR